MDRIKPIQAGSVIELTPLIRRVTAPNPGMMTGPGTNTYILGAETLAVIDPGPANEAHLAVLRDVGLVHVRRDGRRMLYRTNAEAIRPLHEWAATFQRFWDHQLSRIKERAEARSQPLPQTHTKGGARTPRTREEP